MIKLLRIDDRLVHGQVAVSWVSFTGADTLLVANEQAVNDKMMQAAFSMATPPQVLLSIKNIEGAILVINNPKHENRNILVITASIDDALTICNNTNSIKTICLGGIRKAESKKMIDMQVYLDEHDINNLKKLHELNKEIFLQAVPSGRKLGYEDIIKEFYK